MTKTKTKINTKKVCKECKILHANIDHLSDRVSELTTEQYYHQCYVRSLLEANNSLEDLIKENETDYLSYKKATNFLVGILMFLLITITFVIHCG